MQPSRGSRRPSSEATLSHLPSAFQLVAKSWMSRGARKCPPEEIARAPRGHYPSGWSTPSGTGVYGTQRPEDEPSAGARLCVRHGPHRQQRVPPRPGDVLTFESSAIARVQQQQNYRHSCTPRGATERPPESRIRHDTEGSPSFSLYFHPLSILKRGRTMLQNNK